MFGGLYDKRGLEAKSFQALQCQLHPRAHVPGDSYRLLETTNRRAANRLVVRARQGTETRQKREDTCHDTRQRRVDKRRDDADLGFRDHDVQLLATNRRETPLRPVDGSFLRRVRIQR